ncbi:Protease prsW family protein [Cryptosporidium hominis]|nr:putative integral membrane protein [Cryptosporidium hominis]PPA65737.1 Protease prsW family protein [Cryptosporidium hominis]
MRNTSSLLHNTSINNNPYHNSLVIDINHTNIGEYVQENKKYPSNSFIILILLISTIIIINHECHYLKSNFGYVIAGISCSLGFAIIENIVYLSNSMESIIIMILVGIARGIISIPFHIFASGYTTILFSRQIFIQDDYYSTNNNNYYYYYYPIYILKQIIIKFLTLLPAGILHGIYDSSLIILVLINQDYNQDEILSYNLNSAFLKIKIL